MPNSNTHHPNPSINGVSPVGKLRPPVFANTGFGAGVGENLRELFKTGPRGSAGVGLLETWNTGFGGFWQNLQGLVSPPKMGPISADGEQVPEIWSKNPQFTRVQAFSVAIHVVALALIIAPFMAGFFGPATMKPNSPQVIAEYFPVHIKAPPSKALTGGGSSHDKTPADKGKAPKLATMQYAVPMSHPIAKPQIAMPPTVLANQAITLPNVNAPNWGNPLANVLGDSLGNHGGNGIGEGKDNGLGNGDPYGIGQAGHPAGTGGYGNPVCLYCPTAQFSDEAVKAKHQGMVLVAALITPDGRATNVRVVKGLGLGLDENAVAAVRSWRFRPAIGPDGKPAAVLQTIEVEFRLI